MPPPQRSTRSKESLEVRRARGEISCAECRRHKLKCDKSIPCSTCIRKGCQALCPNGTLTPGHGARLGSGDMDVHQRKISQMSKRIRQLEDALQISHSAITTVPHPLLSEDILESKSKMDRPLQPKKESDVSDEETIDSFGTLAVLGQGIESYVGTDALLANHLSSAEPFQPKASPTPPPPVSYLSETFPFTPLYLPAREIQTVIEEKLPTLARASALIEAYLENLSWIMRPVDREQIIEELIPEVYRRRSAGSNASNEATPADPHVLALLLAVFACGAVADLTLALWNEEANLYYHLARTAVSLKPVFDGASLHAVQAIALLGSYDLFTCQKNSLEGTWKMISFCMSLAASIGLHRDPAHFKLSPKLVQRRRQLFWELYSMDVWKSIGSGRPMTFTPAVVDCELPEDEEAMLSEDGTELPSLWQLRHRFIKEVMIDVVDRLSAARALKYSEILSLDQKIRDFGPQQLFSLAVNASVSQPNAGSMQNLMKQFLLVLLKDSALLLLHRNFFPRAVVTNPTNPMRSHFAPSFLSTYRSAATMLRVVREQFDSCAHFLIRLWPVWAHSLSASVMLGSIAACGAASALAPQAFVEFNLAIELFTKAHTHPLVKEGLPILLRLRDQAYQALLKHGNQIPSYRPPVTVNRPPAKENEKEFNAVSGFGRMIRKGMEGQFGYGPQPISNFLDKMPLPETRTTTPSSASGTFSVTSESVYGMFVGKGAATTSFASSSERESCESDPKSGQCGNSSQQISNGDTTSLATLGTASLLDTSSESFQPSAQSGSYPTSSFDSFDSSDNLQPRTNNAHALDVSSEMQVDRASVASTECSPGSRFNRDVNSQDLDTRRAAYLDPSGPEAQNKFASSSNTDSGVYATGSGSRAEHPEMQTQAHSVQSRFGAPMTFDALSTLSPKTVFNADFDVSFDMRASMGNESILPLLSQDLEAWRTILQDSRFFGIANDSETQRGSY